MGRMCWRFSRECVGRIAQAQADSREAVTRVLNGDPALIKAAVARLLEMQETDSAWPYEGDSFISIRI